MRINLWERGTVQKKINGLPPTYLILIFIFLPTLVWAIEKPSITIHGLINLTGIHAPLSIPYERGGKDFLAYISDHGGLDINNDGKGEVEVKYLWAEIGDSQAQLMSAYKRFQMGRARFNLIEMISYPKPRISVLENWPPQDLDMETILERDGVFGFGITLNDSQIHPSPWNFYENGSHSEMAAGTIEYFIEHLWPKQGKGMKPRVALVTWEKSFGKVSMNRIKKHATSTGKYEVVVEQSLMDMAGEEELSKCLSDLEKRGVNIIWLNGTLQAHTFFMKTFHKLGLSNKMFLLGNPSSPPDDLLEKVGPVIAEGYNSLQPVFIPSVEPDEAGIKFARMLNEKYHKDPIPPTISYIRGIRMKAMILESIRRALVGIMKRDNIDLIKACKMINGKEIKALGPHTLAGYSAYETTTGLQTAPSEKGDYRLTDHYRLVGIKDGRVVILSPWYRVPRLLP